MAARLKGWRTLIFNTASLLALAALLAQVTGYLVTVPWGVLLSTEAALILGMGLNVANIVLRFISTTPVGNPTP